MTIPHNALTDTAKVFHFEFWLRYYFIEERDGKLFITLTDEQARQMQAQFPDYWELVERVQGQPLSPELSQQSVVEFLQLNLEGNKYPVNTITRVLDSKEFSVEMYLFNTWVEVHEEQLMDARLRGVEGFRKGRAAGAVPSAPDPGRKQNRELDGSPGPEAESPRERTPGGFLRFHARMGGRLIERALPGWRKRRRPCC